MFLSHRGTDASFENILVINKLSVTKLEDLDFKMKLFVNLLNSSLKNNP